MTTKQIFSQWQDHRCVAFSKSAKRERKMAKKIIQFLISLLLMIRSIMPGSKDNTRDSLSRLKAAKFKNIENSIKLSNVDVTL